MEEKIRVQDDLYMFTNKEWLDKAVIPDDKPTTGGFSDLATQVEDLLIADFKKMSQGKTAVPDANTEKAVALYKIAKNVEKRNKEGLKPVLKTLEKIYNLNTVTDFNKKLKEMVLNDYPLPFSLSVDTDMKDSLHYALMITGPSTILPDTTYYKEELKAQHDALLSVWKDMASKLLGYTPLNEEERTTYVENAIKFDAIIATLVKSSEEWSEYVKMYNPMTLKKVCSLIKPVKLKKLLTAFYGENLPEEIIVADVKWLKGFKTLFSEETFTLYKCWAYVDKVIQSSSLLSEELRETGAIYSMALSGVQSLPTIEKQAYRLASGCFSEPVGLYYGRKYFGEEAKRDVVEMVKEIIATYKKRVQRNDFLSEETKQKALLKLDKIEIKMGYPDKADEIYDSFTVSKNASLYQSIEGIKAVKTKDNFDKLYKDVDRAKWVMPGHMVNACYNPFSNDITFPAAILQPPFYSIKQTRSQNLGGIGAVIGHEISHAFDNNGAKCDENGNLNNWWTKDDFKKFTLKTKAMIKEFEGIELPWGKVNAKFIVSENIADNGGMAVTLEIMSGMKDADYKEYFFNWARIWCMKAREEYLKLLLQVDVHAPCILRANMQPRNFTEWYDTFEVKSTDKMYIAPQKRVVIW